MTTENINRFFNDAYEIIITNSRSRSNLTTDADASSADEQDESDIETVEDTTQSPSDFTPVRNQISKRKRPEKKVNDLDAKLLDIIAAPQDPALDDIDHFVRSLAGPIRSLNSSQQMQAKIKILQVIQDFQTQSHPYHGPQMSSADNFPDQYQNNSLWFPPVPTAQYQPNTHT